MTSPNVPQIITDIEWNKLVDERAQEILDSRSGGVPRITSQMQKEAKDRAILQLQGSYTVVPLGDDADVTTLIKNEGVRLGYWDKDINTMTMGRRPEANRLRNEIRAAGGANAWIAQGKPDPLLTEKDISNITGSSATTEEASIHPIHQTKTTVGSGQKDDTTAAIPDNRLIAKIIDVFRKQNWQTTVGDLTDEVLSALKYDDNNILTPKSQNLWNAYNTQLTIAQKRQADIEKRDSEFRDARTKASEDWYLQDQRLRSTSELERYLQDQRNQNALLVSMLENPFNVRALTGRGLYLDPQNLGDYSRMDPFRRAQYGADLGLIGETPESIGRMVTPAAFAERSAPMLRELTADWRRNV